MFSPLHPLQLALGLLVWAVWFSVVYSVIGIACGMESLRNHTLVNVVLVAFTLLVAGYLLWCAYRCRKCWSALERSGESEAAESAPGPKYPAAFMASLAFGINALAGSSTLLVGLPLVLFLPCVR